MKHLLLTFFLLGMLLIAQPWHVPQSGLRIRFSLGPNGAQNLLLPIPEELKTAVADACARDDKGNTLPATPIRIGNAVVAVAVDATAAAVSQKKAKAGVVAASLYLLREKDASPSPYAGNPVAFHHVLKSLTTRAHSHSEMLRLFANLGFVPYPRYASSPRKTAFRHAEIKRFWDFGANAEIAAIPPAKHGNDSFLRSCSCATTAFLLDKPAKIAFSTDRASVAWTILVDAVPVANWTNEGAALPQWHELAPGIHTLQLIAVQSFGEPLPTPLVRFDEKQKPAPLPALLPANSPVTIGLEAKTPQGTITTLTLQRTESYLFAQTDDALDLFTATIGGKSNSVSCMDSNGHPQPLADIFLANGHFLPAMRFTVGDKRYTIPGRRIWHPDATAIHCAARLSSPAFQDAHQPMRLTLTLDLPPYFPEVLKKHMVITVQQLHADGRAACPARVFSEPSERLDMEIAAAPYARKLVISGTIGNAKAFKDIRLALVYPNDAHTPLRAQGTQLFVKDMDGVYATLLANDLPPTALAQKSPSHKKMIFDDFLLTTLAPGADMLPPPPFHLVAATAPAGTDARLAAPAAIHRLLAEKPEAAFILANPRAFDDEDALRLTAIANACATHGIRPIIVILPALPGIAPATARETAFALKTWAARRHILTKDLYTKALLENIDTADWHTANALNITTIHNAARQWLYRQLQ